MAYDGLKMDAVLPKAASSSTETAEPAEAGEASEVDAARDVLSAIKAGDPKALSLALERHYEACNEDTETPEEA